MKKNQHDNLIKPVTFNFETAQSLQDEEDLIYEKDNENAVFYTLACIRFAFIKEIFKFRTKEDFVYFFEKNKGNFNNSYNATENAYLQLMNSIVDLCRIIFWNEAEQAFSLAKIVLNNRFELNNLKHLIVIYLNTNYCLVLFQKKNFLSEIYFLVLNNYTSNFCTKQLNCFFEKLPAEVVISMLKCSLTTYNAQFNAYYSFFSHNKTQNNLNLLFFNPLGLDNLIDLIIKQKLRLSPSNKETQIFIYNNDFLYLKKQILLNKSFNCLIEYVTT